jgi:hypothetical protein
VFVNKFWNISSPAFSQPTANDTRRCIPRQINYATDVVSTVVVVKVVPAVVGVAAVANRNAQAHLR